MKNQQEIKDEVLRMVDSYYRAIKTDFDAMSEAANSPGHLAELTYYTAICANELNTTSDVMLVVFEWSVIRMCQWRRYDVTSAEWKILTKLIIVYLSYYGYTIDPDGNPESISFKHFYE